MKRCPSCNVEYFDEVLEFCLEDGAKLQQVSGLPTESKLKPPNRMNAETVALPF